MPVNQTSRYRALSPYVVRLGGEPTATIPARLVPGPEPVETPYYHTVIAGETIESLAWRYLGSSEAWWQIADVNEMRFPTDLLPASLVVIPTGAAPGQVIRTRTF
jgi:hypothetical protein